MVIIEMTLADKDTHVGRKNVMCSGRNGCEQNKEKEAGKEIGVCLYFSLTVVILWGKKVAQCVHYVNNLINFQFVLYSPRCHNGWDDEGQLVQFL